MDKGAGFGLAEVRAVMKAHFGDIHAKCSSTQIFRREKRGFRVSFFVELPIRNKRTMKGGKRWSKKQ
jgi:signal transduction histidine kinase